MALWRDFEMSRSISDVNAGFSVRYEKGLDDELRYKYISLCRWLRKNYVFPVRLKVRVLNRETIALRNGKTAYGSFRYGDDCMPDIRIPSKPEEYLFDEFSKEEIHEQILSSFIHELTHYFQWVSEIEQSDAASERQADYYRYRILEMYYVSQKEGTLQ